MDKDEEDLEIYASSEDIYNDEEDDYDRELRSGVGSGVELDIEAEYQDIPRQRKGTGGEAIDDEPPDGDEDVVEEVENEKETGDGDGDEGEEVEGTGEAEEVGEEEEKGEEGEEGEEGETEEKEQPAEAEEVEDVEDVEEYEEVEEVKEEKPEPQREGDFMATCGTGGMLLVDTSHDTWPRDMTLFVLKSMYDVPLPEHADCLAVDVLLRVCDLDFEVEEPLNVEYMSPSGRAPFLKCGRQLVSELDPILRHLSRKGASLSGDLSDETAQKQQELWSLVQSSLSEVEQRVCWLHYKTRNRLTLPKVAGRYPWPLSTVIGRRKRKQALAWLAARENTGSDLELNLDTVYKQVDDVCNTLSTELGGAPFFFGDKPTELEALIYGHLYLLLTVPVPVDEATTISQLIQEYPNLVSMVAKMDDEIFGRDLEIFMNM